MAFFFGQSKHEKNAFFFSFVLGEYPQGTCCGSAVLPPGEKLPSARLDQDVQTLTRKQRSACDVPEARGRLVLTSPLHPALPGSVQMEPEKELKVGNDKAPWIEPPGVDRAVGHG